jgi:hypothetical protein
MDKENLNRGGRVSTYLARGLDTIGHAAGLPANQLADCGSGW